MIEASHNMTARMVASMAFDCSKGSDLKSNLWMGNPDIALTLACCPVMNSTSCSPTTELESSEAQGQQQTMNPQDDEVGSAMTEEFTSFWPENGPRRPQQEAISFMDWSSVRSSTSGSTEKKPAENRGALERMGSGMSVVSGDSEGGGQELRKYSMSEGKLPSSQYKGVVPQPNGRWGAQIYEKHQRVWLGTFNREEDAAKAYDRAALKFRGRDAITNFRPVRDGDPETRFMSERTKGEIVDMLRKHTFDEELHHHTKTTSVTTTAAAAPSMNSGEEGDRQENEGCCPGSVAVDGNANASSLPSPQPGNSTSGPSREPMFDKALTPSDVGKLNRLVIPKQHAEKYFPLDVNSSEKGLLLNFEDNTGKVWRFRYSYWNSSQSYVLTKGWSRFVKDKKLEAGDIVSFHKGKTDPADPHQLYITWRRRPCTQQGAPLQSKVTLAYGSLNPFHPAQHVAAYNPQWMHIFWPNSESPLGHVDATLWPPQSPAIPLYFSTPPKQADRRGFCGIPSDGLCVNINNIAPSPGRPPVLQDPPEKKEAASSFEPPTKKRAVRLFGVNLTESRRLPSQGCGELILFRS